ncbi:MAG: orotate phosphoribosyltransferase [Chloroflexi bacterium]|nr:orotate phosphoribosyltransferase [Chloroflexota bacterium]
MSEPLLPLRESLRAPEGYPQAPVSSHDETLSARRVEGLLLATGALQRGHFLLKSGRHGDRYLEKWALLQHPDAAAEVCRLLAERALAVAAAAAIEIDLVAGPTTGGVLLAYEIGRLLGVRGIFAEEVVGEGGAVRREFRRGFQIPPRARVLMVDDILTTGGSLQALLPPLLAAGAHPVAAAVVASRSPDLRTLEVPGREPIPLIAALTLNLPTYEASACPLCAAGEPIGAPGSSGR